MKLSERPSPPWKTPQHRITIVLDPDAERNLALLAELWFETPEVRWGREGVSQAALIRRALAQAVQQATGKKEL